MSDEARSLHLEKRDGAARCAYCHDPLTDHAGVTCAGCGTRLHDDCVVEARCPTLGCQRTFDAPAAAYTREERGGAPGREHPSRLRRGMALIAGVLLPVACFVLNEGDSGRQGLGLLPEWKYDRFWSWLGQFPAADVQRPFYPLLVWSIAAYLAAWAGARGPWVRVGLRGGVVLAALFSAMYLHLLPAAAVGVIFFGVGLLGFGPYLALIAYARAAWVDARRQPSKTGTPEPEASYLPWAIWSVLGVTATALVIQRMNERWAALPTEDPTCFVATAAARGHARVVGAAPVRLAHGRVLLVTRQLRALKAFELALAHLLPRAHRALRCLYDRVGPPVAARLGPTTATLAWVALLPAQAVAELTLRALFRDADRLISRTYRP